MFLLTIMTNQDVQQRFVKNTKNKNVIEYICSSLKWKILDGQYSIGERITEESIAKELNVSRNSVRTAILQLKNEGLLTDGPTKGVMVKDISIKEANEILDIRIVLETYAIKESIKQINDTEIRTLYNILLSMENAINSKDYELYSSLNTRFHNIIYQSVHNDIMQNLLLETKSKMLRYQFKVAFIPGRAEKSFREHLKIYRAIEKKDAEMAEEAIKEHLESLRMCIDTNRKILEIRGM